ncbi:hypothetical protein Ocepr_2381 (plasmid) [Oceanithermus profundus DSM 14977]|uniref:Uncharacterized protein n=1 Tax=Oceanithermus profundus (strain DSM 14977 / NBRC 100410 / VKM B-2274 / 506) TaxID=670487 RepID=E4UAQ0_OCEP5|nr:hypothetical protein [Oceanithermus profundus]ADR37829.1 hypothetical protein Ocepr_2381 [Oceanithermus profundus DSM 14977]
MATKQQIDNWVPRLRLVLGKGGMNESGPKALLQRARALGARSIGVNAVGGRLEVVFHGLGREALPKLTQGISNWAAIEYPKPYTLMLYVKTEDREAPAVSEVNAELLLDLGGMGISDALAGFTWFEAPDAAWAEQAKEAFKRAAQTPTRQVHAQG